MERTKNISSALLMTVSYTHLDVYKRQVLDRTEASCDQEPLPALILSDTGVPDRTASILTGNTEPMYQRLLADARLLEECGCTVKMCIRDRSQPMEARARSIWANFSRLPRSPRLISS